MEAIREIQTVENGEVHLHLPEQFWGQRVEIIVLAMPERDIPEPIHKKSLRGALKRHANPELMAKEQAAWQKAASEKHEPS